MRREKQERRTKREAITYFKCLSKLFLGKGIQINEGFS